METIKVNIAEVKNNPNNPRLIKDDKFKKLVKSIKEFPEMLDIRPIVVNSDMIVLGGNMRFKAAKEAGLKEIPIVITDLSEEKQREFIIKDNVRGGEWDWDVIANEWGEDDIKDWGLDIPNFNDQVDGFEIEDSLEKEGKHQIILEYTLAEYDLVIEAFSRFASSKEEIIFKLLV